MFLCILTLKLTFYTNTVLNEKIVYVGVYQLSYTLRLLTASSSEMLVTTYGSFKFASKNTVALILAV